MGLHRNVNEKLARTLYPNGETKGSCSVAALWIMCESEYF